MKHHRRICSVFAVLLIGESLFAADADIAVPLPSGVHAVWNAATAYRETTSTRDKICINGLWRWQPAESSAQEVPGNRWGYFKVPGSWPGITNYMQKDFQSIFAHASWQGDRLDAADAAWYQREIEIPAEWTGRRIALSADYVNSVAIVFVDGVKRGEIRFPGGELDLTTACRPGTTHVLSILVLALPLKAVLLSYADTNTAREVKGRVARRGLCGDVFLASTPTAERIGDVKVDTSVRRGEISFDVAVQQLRREKRYTLEAHVIREGRTLATFSSRSFGADDLTAGRIQFTQAWLPDALWDLHTPRNTYSVRCSLREVDGRACDTHFDARFGFREFWIDGRDFFLNGSRIALSAVPLDNAQVGAALASYEGARESLLRLKSIGINFVYTHNYGCQPGSHLGFAEILRAADDVGMLVALSQPHFSHYDWKEADADRANGYAHHAEFYVRAAQNHPAVVAYAMNHNATGTAADMNPDLIDGIHDPRDAARAQGNARLALRAEAIVKRIDSSRVVYHHSSGNLGSMYTINFYPNFVPPQELSDWFEHWATTGVKPVFLCEYGAPFTWDWTMYRGWYKGERAFGDARVPWQFSLAEWNAQFLGDVAFQISAREAANLRWEAKQLQSDKVWHRWDYPTEVNSRDFDERYPIIALYLADNWPAYRTWGVSAISPWQFGHYWKLRPGVDRRRQELSVDWAHLQRPGFSPDFIENRYERMDLAFARDDWIPSVAAQALLRYNQPLLAYIAGKPTAFTSKDHLFTAGEPIEKQLIVINNSRERVSCEASWSLAAERAPPAAGRSPEPRSNALEGGSERRATPIGTAELSLAPGEQKRLPLRFALPATLATGEYRISATVKFSNGEAQSDAFPFHVAPRASRPDSRARIALFDPKGDSAALLMRLGIRCEPIDATADLTTYDLLIVGKQALTTTSAAPDIARVRDGLKVIVFEQASDVLEKRFGFRVAEYGLRRVFSRVPDHPALNGIRTEHLRDWRGEATLLSPRLEHTMRPRYGPTVMWCDIPVPRLWRCGNRGNVASVLIEKPARGNFLPIIDGGFGLQYSPLLECRDGRGMILFCQLDVSGRTETEPVGDAVTANVLRYVLESKAPEAPLPSVATGTTERRRSRFQARAFYVGEAAGKAYFDAAEIPVAPYDGRALAREDVLVFGPRASRGAAPSKATIVDFVNNGGRIVAIGLDQNDADELLPLQLRVIEQEHVSTWFEAFEFSSPFVGIAPADLLNRDPRRLPLVDAGARVAGNGVLAASADGNIVFCQLVPWHFDPEKQSNLKRTFRRAAFTLARVLANQGVASVSPVIERFRTPVTTELNEKRWSHGFYLDQPEEWDDPYRFFRW